MREGIIEYGGRLDDVRDELAQCSIFALPSYREGTPMSVLEALAVGRPIVSTDVPGCRETVCSDGGGNGVLVPAQNAKALADALLFVEDAPLPQSIRGTSGFAERFSLVGPRDRRGRTLRQLDLTTRLMRYPCSYLIHSPMFEALPATMRNRVYDSMWQVLSGANTEPRYRHLSRADRQAIVEILLDTRPGWPATYARVTR